MAELYHPTEPSDSPRSVQWRGSFSFGASFYAQIPLNETGGQIKMKCQIREILPAFGVHALTVSVLVMVFPLFNWAGTASDQSLTCTEMEEFLRLGKFVAQKSIPKGVTLPQRATLEYKGMKHDAAIQTVDI